MLITTKAEETKKMVYGYQIIRCEEMSDCTGKVSKFWMLYNPVVEEDEAGFENYKEALRYAKEHSITRR